VKVAATYSCWAKAAYPVKIPESVKLSFWMILRSAETGALTTHVRARITTVRIQYRGRRCRVETDRETWADSMGCSSQ